MGARVRKLRADQGLTLDDLASKSGLSKGFLSLVERGGCLPGTRPLLQLADALGVTTDSLARGEK